MNIDTIIISDRIITENIVDYSQKTISTNAFCFTTMFYLSCCFVFFIVRNGVHFSQN